MEEAETERRQAELAYGLNVPVQMCDICSIHGEFTPRWFRFEDEEHLIHTIRVLAVVSKKELNFVGIRMLQFICKVNEDSKSDMEYLVEMRYHVSAHRWFFFQRLS